jgi:lipopolysaccharide/colanic/teichoic acid biosynthesis glycosyltransferase
MNWGNPKREKVVLLAGDAALAAAAMLVASLSSPGPAASPWERAALLVTYVCVYAACFYVFDLYNVRAFNGIRTFTRLAAASLCGTGALSLLMYTLSWRGLHRKTLGIAVLLLLLGAMAWRKAFVRNRSVLVRKRPALLIGVPEDAAMLEEISRSEHSPYELRAFLRLRSSEIATEDESLSNRTRPLAVAAAASAFVHRSGAAAVIEQPAVAGFAPPWRGEQAGGALDLGLVSRTRLESAVIELGVDTIVVRRNPNVAELAETLTELRFRGVRIATLPDFCSQILEELPVGTLSDEWLSFAEGFPFLHQKIVRRIKRISDILFAGAGLIVTLPIALLAAVAIKLDSRGPVLFRQCRVGWMENPFFLLKFRSMHSDAETDGMPQWAAVCDPRVTRVGRILRALHIDEIPQMINVLRGEMSFIGPRPERPEFVEQLKSRIPFYSLRHYVPPGITGWAQVNYPYGASVEDAKRKLEFDLYYARNASPTLDLRILLRTARVILFRLGSR